MPSPVNLRVATRIPFPALVRGQVPVTVTKANGVWTVAYDVSGIAPGVPLIGAYATDYVLVWDSVAKTFVNVSLATLASSSARLQRAANASPIVVAGNDQIINFNINAGAPTCQLPLSASRSGVPITFKDAGGHAAAHHLTFTTTGGETMDGVASGGVALSTNFGEITFRPYNDGTNTGYAVE